MALLGAFVVAAMSFAVAGHAADEQFGDIVVHYNAISTDALFASAAKAYGIAQSPRNGLVNIAVEQRAGDGSSASVRAQVSGSVADLTGHPRPIRFRETHEAGSTDYLGEFPIDSSGTYVFTIEVRPDARSEPYRLRFSHDFVVD